MSTRTDRMPIRSRSVWPVAAILLFLVLAIAHWRTLPPLTAGDYAQNLLHAKALADGRPYSDVGYIYTSYNALVGPTSQPPGLPLALTPIVALGGVHSAGIKLLMIGFGVLFLVTVVRVLGRLGDFHCAIGAALLTGIAIEAWYLTAVPGSDLGFAAIVWLLIASIDTNSPWTGRRIATVTILGFMAMAFRLAGVGLLPALALYAVVNRRTMGVKLFIPVAIWGIGALIALLSLSGIRSHGALTNVDAVRFLTSIPRHVVRYRHAVFASELYPFATNRLDDIYHVVATILMIIGAVAIARKWSKTFLGAFVLSYGLLILLSTVNEARYALPLLPVLSYAMLAGALAVVRRLLSSAKEGASQRAVLAGAAFIGLMACRTMLARPDPPSLLGNADVQSLFQQLRQLHAGQPLRVVFTNPRVLTLETGIPAMVLFAATPEHTIQELRSKRITHVVRGDLGMQPYSRVRFDTTIATYPAAFKREYQNTSFVLYRFLGDAVSTP